MDTQGVRAGAPLTGVVVPFLRPPDLIARHKHRHTARKHEDRGEIPDLSFPQPFDRGILGRTFRAAVPAQVFVDAVAVAFAVGLVVLVVVAHKIVEGETVVASNIVDAVDGEMAAGVVDVGAVYSRSRR